MTITHLLDHFHVPVPGLQSLEDFAVAWTKFWGAADLRSGPTATDESLYQAALISKAVAAMASPKAAQIGLIYFDQDVNTILKSWRLQDEQLGSGASADRILMSHTSGIGDGTSLQGFLPGKPLLTVQLILEGLDRSMAVVLPGTGRRCSGSTCTGCPRPNDEAARPGQAGLRVGAATVPYARTVPRTLCP